MASDYSGLQKLFFMKKTILLLLSLTTAISFATAQLKAKASCGVFSVDILNGTVNNLRPDFNADQIKEQLPCSTSEDQSDGKCGRALFYKDRDINFYVQRQYVEIGPAFKGKLSIPIMGASRGNLFKWLGNPSIKDTDWDAFQMQYGTLVLHYTTAGKVRLIQFSTKPTETLNLCE
jgi:hypothetical protein